MRKYILSSIALGLTFLAYLFFFAAIGGWGIILAGIFLLVSIGISIQAIRVEPTKIPGLTSLVLAVTHLISLMLFVVVLSLAFNGTSSFDMM